MDILEGYNLRCSVADIVHAVGEYDTDWNTVKYMPLARGAFISLAKVGGEWEAVLWTREIEVAVSHEEPATAAWNCFLQLFGNGNSHR